MRQYKWGIIGTGSISHLFAQGLKDASGANLYCIASRSKQKADAFARNYNIPVAYGSYEELADDPHVEIVYIGTPNSLHCDNSLLCLQKKKAVLCEKPFAMNTDQVEKMIHYAQKNNCFLMEALWSRFLPSIQKVQWLIDNKVVGDPICIKADFGFLADYKEESRLFNPLLGGGSLLDIGIYPVFSLSAFGYPDEISSHAVMAPTGLISPQEYFFPEIGSICTTGIFIRCGFRYRSSNLLHKGQNHPSPQIPHAHKTLNQYCRWMQRNTSGLEG